MPIRKRLQIWIEKNGSTEELSLKYPVPGCKFGSFAKTYDKYQTGLTERIITIMEIMMLCLLQIGIGLIGIMVKEEEEKEVWKLLLLPILLKCNKLASSQLC